MEKNERYGVFKCPYCTAIFFDKKKLSGHIGGKHRKGISLTNTVLRCKHCNKKLIEGKNWPLWAVKQRNMICKQCKNKINMQFYRNRKKKEKEERKQNIIKGRKCFTHEKLSRNQKNKS